MYHTVLLELGLAWERGRHVAQVGYKKTADKFDEVLNRLDAKYTKPYPCTGNFMCMREMVRHKSGCPGRTVPIEKYVRELQG